MILIWETLSYDKNSLIRLVSTVYRAPSLKDIYTGNNKMTRCARKEISRNLENHESIMLELIPLVPPPVQSGFPTILFVRGTCQVSMNGQIHASIHKE